MKQPIPQCRYRYGYGRRCPEPAAFDCGMWFGPLCAEHAETARRTSHTNPPMEFTPIEEYMRKQQEHHERQKPPASD